MSLLVSAVYRLNLILSLFSIFVQEFFFHFHFKKRIDVFKSCQSFVCLWFFFYMLSGCKSRVDDDASGFNRSMVRMFVNGVAASVMLTLFRPPFPLCSALIRAKSTFELTCAVCNDHKQIHAHTKQLGNFFFINEILILKMKL